MAASHVHLRPASRANSDDVTEPFARPLRNTVASSPRRLSSEFLADAGAQPSAVSLLEQLPKTFRRRKSETPSTPNFVPANDLEHEVTRTLTDIKSLASAALRFSELRKQQMAARAAEADDDEVTQVG